MAQGRAAFAWDWTITGNAGETLTQSDNPNLQIPPAWGGSSDSFLNLNIEGRTPTLKMDLNTGINYTAYWGPGWDNQSNFPYPSLNLSITKTTKTTDFFLNASASISDLQTTLQQEDFRFTNVNGTTTNLNAGGGFTHKFDPINSFTWTADYGVTTYDPVGDGLYPTTSISSSVTWSHSMNKLHDIGPTVSFNWYNYNISSFTPSPTFFTLDPGPPVISAMVAPSGSDIPPPDITSLTATGWWNARLTKRLTLRSTFGVGIFNQAYDGRDQFNYTGSTPWLNPPTDPTVQKPCAADPNFPNCTYKPKKVATWSVVPVWSVTLVDQIWDNSTFTFSASESTSPNSFGDLQSTFNIGMGFSHTINEASDISLGFNYSENSGGTTAGVCADPSQPCAFRNELATNNITFDVVYNRQLWRYWSASLGYTFERSKFDNNGDGSADYANENLFTATIKREFTLLR
ncbi:MAG: hypothetical protein U1E46_16060 [Hyphomicrobiales bacterium]